MLPNSKIAIFLSILVIIVIIIVGISIYPETNKESSSSNNDESEILESSLGPYNIPVHVYEIWNSQGVIIHGNVDKQDEKSAVEIQIKDQHGKVIDTANILPDDSGRFIHGVVKFIPLVSETDPRWENVTSYDVSAVYKYHAASSTKENDMLNNITFDKNKIPLNSEQISNLSHDEIIRIITEWNEMGGSVPFITLFIIGIEDAYDLGEPIQFAVQKSGYGNPCPNQGVSIFDENTKEHIRTELYMEFCNIGEEDEITEAFDYLIPYNLGVFTEIPPITKPGNYVMVARSDYNSKHIERFTILDSDHTFEHKLVYSMQQDSTSNKRTMEIDLTDGKMLIENTEDRSITEASLDSETLERLNLEIVKNHFISNPFTNQWYGELCNTCNLGEIALYIDGVMAHHIGWDDKSLENPMSEFGQGTPEDGEFLSYFRLVDCISSKNNFDTYWISDSISTAKKYAGTAQGCGELVEESSEVDYFFLGLNTDYDLLVNDKPKSNIP